MMYRMIALALWSMVSRVHGQNFTSNGCLYTMAQLILLEGEVTDFSTTREYTICENRVFQIGSLDMNNDLISGSGDASFPVRPNMHIRCGATGARENNCLVLGGDVQVDGTSYFGIGTDLDLTNVVFEGFTFAAATRYSVWATKKGDITFIDCEWKDMTDAYAPLYFDYYDPSALSTVLDITLSGCSFQNNVYYGDGAYPAIITANGDQNQLTVDRCDFSNNDYTNNNTKFEKNSYLIESSGSLTLSLNCFTNNSVGVSPAVAYGPSAVSDNNFGTSSNGTTCGFLSHFQSATQFQAFTPVCKDFEATSRCLSDTTGMPSASPTGFPSTIPPSNVPSSPTGAPTSSSIPSPVPSKRPTGKPTTQAPSNLDPSTAPSPAPSDPVPTTSAGVSHLVAKSLVLAILIATTMVL